MIRRVKDAEELEQALTEILTDYTQTVTDKCNEATEQLAKYGKEELRHRAEVAGIGGRKYKRSFRWQVLEKSPFGNVYLISSTNYRLTHLLEHGHRIYSHGKYTGKSTRAFRHWSDVEEELDQKMTEAAVKAVNEANRG